MKETIYHLILFLGGILLIWLAFWNIKKDDEEGKGKTDPRYSIRLVVGFIAALAGLLFLLQDFIELF